MKRKILETGSPTCPCNLKSPCNHGRWSRHTISVEQKCWDLAFVTFCYPRAFVSTSYRRCNGTVRRKLPSSFLPLRGGREKGRRKGGKKKRTRGIASFRQLSLVAVVAGVSRPVSGGIRFLSRWTGSRSRPIRSSAAEKIMCLSLPVRASIK